LFRGERTGRIRKRERKCPASKGGKKKRERRPARTLPFNLTLLRQKRRGRGGEGVGKERDDHLAGGEVLGERGEGKAGAAPRGALLLQLRILDIEEEKAEEAPF